MYLTIVAYLLVQVEGKDAPEIECVTKYKLNPFD
jgi:hypothetical protein